MDNLNNKLTSIKADKKPIFNKTYLFLAGFAVLAIIAAIYFYLQYRAAQSNTAQVLTPSVALNETNSKQITDELAKLMILPTDEEPYVALVRDAASLKDQPFLIKAQNGDVLFMYIKAKRAILYRPSENKIVDVGPINVKN